MNRDQLAAPWHRLSSVLIATIPFVVIAAILGAGYLFEWTALTEEVTEHKTKIERVGWIAANAKRLTVELAEADRAMSAHNVLYVGSPESATADLQGRVKALLDSAAVQISSIQPAEIEEEEGGVNIVSVRAQASGSYEKVLGFLQAARNSTPTLLIRAFDLAPDSPPQSDAAGAGPVNYLMQFEAVRLMAAAQ
jgi:hypothetical protein